MKKEKLILHLDDHSLFSDGLKTMVLSELEPYSYKHFTEPSQALSFIKSYHEQKKLIDLILTDFNHPGMNGFHFARQVRISEVRYGLNL